MKGLLTAVFILSLICIFCAVLILLGSKMSITQFLGDNPNAAKTVADKTVADKTLDYELPDGFQEQGGRDIGILRMVAITPGGGEPEFENRPVIIISTYPEIIGLSEDQFRRELRLALLRSTNEVTTLENVQEIKMDIRGEEIAFDVFESYGEYDIPTRILMSSAIAGKKGDVIIIFAGPIADWNQKVFSEFARSIR